MADPLIVTEDLKRHFGEVQALKGVDLQVEQGSVFGLLGPNGAGKTTAVKILTTLIEPSSGRATVAGYDVVKDAERLRSEIGLAGQAAAVVDYLTGPGEPGDGGAPLSPRPVGDEAARPRRCWNGSGSPRPEIGPP